MALDTWVKKPMKSFIRGFVFSSGEITSNKVNVLVAVQCLLLTFTSTACIPEKKDVSWQDRVLHEPTSTASHAVSTPYNQIPTTTREPTEYFAGDMATWEPFITSTPVPTEMLSTPTIEAPPMHESDVHLELTGQVGGAIHALDADGKMLYMGFGLRVVAVDVSNHRDLKIVGQSQILPFIVKHLYVSDGVAYVAGDDGAFWLLDISQPEDIQVLAIVEITGVVNSISVYNGMAFIAEGIPEESTISETASVGGLRVYDLSSPTAPREIAYLHFPGGCESVITRDGFGYVIGWKLPLTIIDIHDPQNLSVIAVADEETIGDFLALGGQYAYTACKLAWVNMIDISDPTSPRLIGEFNIGGYPEALVASQDYLYKLWIYGDGPSGVWGYLSIVEVAEMLSADMGNPFSDHLRISPSSGAPMDLDIDDGMAYVATTVGVRLIDISSLSTARVVGSLDLPTNVGDVAVENGYAYTTWSGWSPDRIYWISIHHPEMPTLTGYYHEFEIPEGCEPGGLSIAVMNQYAFIARSREPSGAEPCDALKSIDLLTLEEIWTEEAVGFGYRDVAIADETMYTVSGLLSGFVAYDIRVPAETEVEYIVMEHQFPDIKGITTIAVRNGYAYALIDSDVTKSSTLRIFNIESPDQPILVGELNFETWGTSLVVDESHAYFSSLGNVMVVDISDPESPILMDEIVSPPIGVGRLALDEGFLYAAAGDGGLLIFQIEHLE